VKDLYVHQNILALARSLFLGVVSDSEALKESDPSSPFLVASSSVSAVEILVFNDSVRLFSPNNGVIYIMFHLMNFLGFLQQLSTYGLQLLHHSYELVKLYHSTIETASPAIQKKTLPSPVVSPVKKSSGKDKHDSDKKGEYRKH